MFNTFQRQTRFLLERLGYFTLTPADFPNTDDPNPIMMTKGFRGIVQIPLLDKLTFWQRFFGPKDVSSLPKGVEIIYLMLNLDTGLFKIGRSKDPRHREKTLQSQEPRVFLITACIAPAALEKQLHTIFSKNKVRGEWFRLLLKNSKKIKQLMQSYP